MGFNSIFSMLGRFFWSIALQGSTVNGVTYNSVVDHFIDLAMLHFAIPRCDLRDYRLGHEGFLISDIITDLTADFCLVVFLFLYAP